MWFVRGASIAAVITLVASCGGNEGASLSAEEFRDQAEAICHEIEETNVPPPSDASHLGRYADEFTAESKRARMRCTSRTSRRISSALAGVFGDRRRRRYRTSTSLAMTSKVRARRRSQRLGRQFDADSAELERRGRDRARTRPRRVHRLASPPNESLARPLEPATAGGRPRPSGARQAGSAVRAWEKTLRTAPEGRISGTDGRGVERAGGVTSRAPLVLLRQEPVDPVEDFRNVDPLGVADACAVPS